MSASTDPFISVVLPVFNEAGHLPESLAQVREHLNALPVRYELVVVDDGSRDQSWAIILAESRAHGDIAALRLSRNFGKEAAVVCGVENARGDAVLVMDSDMQHPPSLIAHMIGKWRDERYDVVEAVKEPDADEHAATRVRRAVFNAVFGYCTGLDMDNASDFKLLDRRVVDQWQRMGEHVTFFRGMVTWLGFRTAKIPFRVPDRTSGRSKWPTWNLVEYAIQSLTSFSAKPLYLIALLGVGFVIGAVVLAIFAIYLKCVGRAVTGFTTVILLQLGIGGAVLFSLAMIGGYVAGIYREVKGRPRYVVAEQSQP
jgi:polyisoprenyl-phosphate glycosyltransferase